jgi:hypothetical protein
MSSEHTELPWVVHDFPEDGLAILTAGGGHEIAAMCGADFDPEEMKASAELIVKAVNNHHRLVEMLETTIAELNCLQGNYDDAIGRDPNTNGAAFVAERFLAEIKGDE